MVNICGDVVQVLYQVDLQSLYTPGGSTFKTGSVSPLVQAKHKLKCNMDLNEYSFFIWIIYSVIYMIMVQCIWDASASITIFDIIKKK